MNVKTELAKKARNIGQVKITKSMAIADMIKALEPELCDNGAADYPAKSVL